MLNQRKKEPLEKAEPPVKKRSAAAGTSKAKPVKAKATPAPMIARQDITPEEIAKLAYLLWESRGCAGGSPEEDWLKAEELLLSGSTAVS